VGLSSDVTRMLLTAHRDGARFTRSAMLGRQVLDVGPDELEPLLAEFGFDVSGGVAQRIVEEEDGFAEPLFRLLGAEEVRSFDASDYERATDIHDFNQPLPPDYDGRFDAVVDAGSLEHIFNVTTALANCMRLVATGGHFLCFSPANNNCGHGFYQFGPEFYYRSLGPENGFELERLLIWEEGNEVEWFEVLDPRVVGQRVTIVNTRPTSLAAFARRVEARPPFAEMPQESDYEEIWRERPERPEERAADRRPGLGSRVKGAVPTAPKRVYRKLRNAQSRRRYGGPAFRRFEP
jgi:SAM-dependent methyltransferase